jgi:hypothetical protein
MKGNIESALGSGAFRCTLCEYRTSRKFNLDKHLCTRKHMRAYLRALMNCAKPSEMWEEEILARQAPSNTLDSFLASRFASCCRQPAEQICARLPIGWSTIYLVAISPGRRPIVPITEDYWLVSRPRGWTRTTGDGLARLAGLLFCRELTGAMADDVHGEDCLVSFLGEAAKLADLHGVYRLYAELTRDQDGRVIFCS